MRWLAVLLCAAAPAALAQFSYPPKMEGAAAEVYKTASGRDLKLYIFNPPGHAATDKRAAIVFFFGGGWKNGSPQQFEQQSRYLASRGMVAIAADYRVASREPVTPADCVRDAKSAIRWVRKNAVKLGVDPDRIAAGGGSAAGTSRQPRRSLRGSRSPERIPRFPHAPTRSSSSTPRCRRRNRRPGRVSAPAPRRRLSFTEKPTPRSPTMASSSS